MSAQSVPDGSSDSSGSTGTGRPGGGANLADLVAAGAKRDPVGIALLAEGASITWAQLEEQVACAAAGLLGLGLNAGDRVAVVLGNVPAFVVTYFAILRAGLVAVPVNTSLTQPELDHVLHDSGALAVVAAEQGTVSLTMTRQRATVPLADLGAELPPMTGSRSGGEDLAVIVYTSGTSGRPRGAMLTHRALLANTEQVAAIEPTLIEPADVVLLVLPLFHIYGLNAGLGLAVSQGATSVLAERFDPVETLALLERHGVSVVVGAPPMYVAWSMLPGAESAFATVRLAISGAAPLPAAVLTRMIEATGHHVFEGYGLTETAPVLTTTLMSAAAKPGSIGRPVPGLELRLDGAAVEVSSKDDVEDPSGPAGEVGVITVRGANLFSGYWPQGSDGPDADGWWSTGDLAYADDDGDLHLVERARELILVSGFNVYPREVEDVLTAHPDVAEAAVLGIPHPYTGESVKALVVLIPEAAVTPGELIEWAARSLARFKCPTIVQVVEDLPHTATGKVSKGRLRELAGESN